MKQAACFDLDGTLIDSTEAIVDSFYHTFDTLGLARPPREAIVDSIGYTLEDQFTTMTEYDPHECTKVYRAYYATICRSTTTLLPGGREILERLAEAGHVLGFATSKRRHFAEEILDELGVLSFFKGRVGPEDVTHPKPHPEAFLKAAEQMGVAPEAVTIVGDTHFDVRAAQNAGMRCYAVTTGYNTRQELESLKPTGVFDTLDEVAEAILRNACPAPTGARPETPGTILSRP